MQMRRLMGVVLIGVMGLGAGCAKRAAAPGEAAAPAAATAAPVPADSPLAKVKIGMSEQDVRAILGPPTQENEYVSGKAFIPFYYGPDRTRRAYFYKGMGRVVFAGGSGFNRTGKVSRVEYDPAESGTAR
jgi:outer membrane protein assembly factor BamE (lipoprotein component of BamABCDE complex)